MLCDSEIKSSLDDITMINETIISITTFLSSHNLEAQINTIKTIESIIYIKLGNNQEKIVNIIESITKVQDKLISQLSLQEPTEICGKLREYSQELMVVVKTQKTVADRLTTLYINFVNFHVKYINDFNVDIKSVIKESKIAEKIIKDIIDSPKETLYINCKKITSILLYRYLLINICNQKFKAGCLEYDIISLIT